MRKLGRRKEDVLRSVMDYVGNVQFFFSVSFKSLKGLIHVVVKQLKSVVGQSAGFGSFAVSRF